MYLIAVPPSVRCIVKHRGEVSKRRAGNAANHLTLARACKARAAQTRCQCAENGQCLAVGCRINSGNRAAVVRLRGMFRATGPHVPDQKSGPLPRCRADTRPSTLCLSRPKVAGPTWCALTTPIGYREAYTDHRPSKVLSDNGIGDDPSLHSLPVSHRVLMSQPVLQYTCVLKCRG